MIKYNESHKEKYLTAFLLGFAVLFVSLLPVIIADGGYFIYYGDYNAQQIPFYEVLNDALRGGQLGWNWFTDLGSDLMTSYSFYLIGSPFFLLTALLPRSWVIFSMPVILAVKHGFASLTAYIYIRRFVRGKDSALVGALLYSFSGFQIFNLFFNHFQDVTALFPLMLIAMEENICSRRRGWFALIVAIMGGMNYYFFTGEAVFLVLYFLMRLPCRDFPATWKKFWLLCLEAVLGTALAGFILLPSALALLENYRIKQHLFGDDMIFYSEKTRVLRAIQTFFMPSDIPARPNLFKHEEAKWSSVGGYFPLFSMLGVLTFARSHKKHWAVRLSLFCTVCAFIPILNSMFYTFNASYYARWYYMPILIFAMMTAHTLDDENADFKPAIRLSAIVLGFFGAVSLIPIKKDNEIKWFSYPKDIAYFALTFTIAVVFLIAAACILRIKNAHPKSGRIMTVCTCIASVICILATVLYGALEPKNAKKHINAAINGSIYEEVSEDNFFRVDISENCDNYPMLWGLPSMRAFQSVVSTSIMDFYDEIGIKRNVASRADITHYTLRGLLSIKYFYREKTTGYTPDELASMSTSPDTSDISDKNGIRASRVNIGDYLYGFEHVGENEYFDIYENTLYVPMGFGYDTYVSEESAKLKSKNLREKILMKALILSEEQIAKYSGMLTEATAPTWNMDENDYIAACAEKRQNCCDSFSYDSRGFTAEISLDTPQLVFFSVPYSDGWSAEVNGVPVDVEKVSYGFMAVPVNPGESTITFRYTTPGLKAGSIISVSGLMLLAIYLILVRFSDKKHRHNGFSHYYDYTPRKKLTAAEVYLDSCRKNSKGE